MIQKQAESKAEEPKVNDEEKKKVIGCFIAFIIIFTERTAFV
jgi:hypothetical protein